MFNLPSCSHFWDLQSYQPLAVLSQPSTLAKIHIQANNLPHSPPRAFNDHHTRFKSLSSHYLKLQRCPQPRISQHSAIAHVQVQ
mmetsp:Transcript_23298/g.36602  ORF Transcript_23298/g.36602 Transcript_23298/m.36602 type:complete len:84 (+) Transcript_23298:744-995(+)